jgi:Zyg-11 family protein
VSAAAYLVIFALFDLAWQFYVFAETPLFFFFIFRHLDISQSGETKYTEPNRMLSRLVESLPNLKSLDISGTNLAGTGVYESRSSGSSSDGESSSVPMSDCDIPGLTSRVDRPLEFLGLYKTAHEACCRSHLPAKKVSGDANEQQILVAGQQYLDRPSMLENVLNDLFHIFRIQGRHSSFFLYS